MSSGPINSVDNYLPQNVILPDDKEKRNLYFKNLLEDNIEMINRKETGSYEEIEQLNNQEYFTADPQIKRNVYRIVIDTGALLNVAPTVVLHNLNEGVAVPATWLFTRIYGFARDPVTPLWIPLSNGGMHDCSLQVTSTQVIITPTVNLAAFTDSYVVLEYVKF